MAKKDETTKKEGTGSSTITPSSEGTGTNAPITPAAETTATATVSEEMVQVKKSDMDLILKKIEDLSKDRDTLFQVADKGRLARIADREGASLIRQVKIARWPINDQYIVGWKLMKNMSEIMPGTGRWVEDQSTTIVFEDGTMQEIPLIDFYRSPIKDIADIIETNTGSKNGVSYTVLNVEFPNGKKLTIDSKFVN